MKKVVVIDDDEELAALIKTVFTHANYSVKTFTTVGRFIDGIPDFPPDLAILDLLLPTLSGWDLIPFLRGRPETKRMPLIVFSGQFTGSKDIVRALGMGADEFFSKPIAPEILLARAEALMRRATWSPAFAEPAPHEQLRIGPLTVDETEHAVTLGGADIKLTPLEFDLLLYLMRNKNRVLTRGMLLENVWKTDPDQSTRTVDKRIEALRRKLGEFGGRIETVSRVGYTFKI